MSKVIISDKMSPKAAEVFVSRGIKVDVQADLSDEKLCSVIKDYDGLAVRSSTQVTEELISYATQLKVIGRAGIGVDNINIPAATSKGIVVMNTPFGNSITTAEHTIAMMMALARQIPTANTSTQAGKWEKSRFMGVELCNKSLGLIGCGNIGSIVARLAIGLRMKVSVYDPYLSNDVASDLGVKKLDLEDLLAEADVISLHVPLNGDTRNILNSQSLKKVKSGCKIINCARGGLIDEFALKDAIQSGIVSGAALDVFSEEPAKDNPLFGMEEIIATPHLGASTLEAQEKVAIQVAEQMSDFLLDGGVTNAINMPSIGVEEMGALGPYLKLADQLGSFAGQLTVSDIKSVTMEFEGDVASLNTEPMSAMFLSGLLRPQLESVNAISALSIARERGIDIRELKSTECRDYKTLLRLRVITDEQERTISGTLFSDDKPRIVNIKGIPIEAQLAPSMLYITNDDRPGLIGAMGGALGDAGVNIGTFSLGRSFEGGDAIALISVDGEVPNKVVNLLSELQAVNQVKLLKF
tara:strand:+ start:74459 stop:76036 length:1578 start_codon:yes stop_codon:yes gene_type:complete